MRYLVQGVAMLGDIMIFVAIFGGTYFLFSSKFSFVSLIALGLMICAFRAWKRQGGFMAWRSAERKKFLEKAKQYGL